MAKNKKSKLQFRFDFGIKLQLNFFLAMVLLVSKIIWRVQKKDMVKQLLMSKVAQGRTQKNEKKN
jgi:hypothetical protein